MRTSYYLVTAAGLAAAAVTVYARLPNADTPPPTLPLPADPIAAGGSLPGLPALPAVPDVPLPPIVTPPDGSLSIPAAGVPAAPRDTGVPKPIQPLPMTPSTPSTPAALPALPTMPSVPVSATPVPVPVASPDEKGRGTPTPLPALPVPPKPETPEPVKVASPPAPIIPPTTPALPPAAAPTTPPVSPSAPPMTVAPPLANPSAPPTTAAKLPVSPNIPPTAPVVPPTTSISAPKTPSVPSIPSAPPSTAPLVAPAPAPIAPKPPTQEPKPFPLPAPTPFTPGLDSLKPEPAANLAATGNFVVLKGNKLVEGAAKVVGDKIMVRQGALDRTFPKAEVLFIGESRDDVYRFMLAKVPATDAAARLAVARWCMLSGLREQALAESREILKFQPQDRAAADLARSLEESLKQFPVDGSTPKTQGTLVTVNEPEPDVTAEAATTFARRAQPVLANQCMECHARTDHASAFKLIRITGFEVGEVSTRNTQANLRAVAAQLKKDDPQNSPLLAKALLAHGGMKQPAFVSRQAVAFKVLESWVLVAVGNATSVIPPMTPPAQPVIPPSPPVTPIPPAIGATTAPTAPLLSPTATAPAISPVQDKLLLPPTEPTPVVPLKETTPVVRPPSADPTIPPVLPTPPSIPPADTSTRTMPPTIPAIPPLGSTVKPASGSGSGFGAGAKPTAPPTGPANDEFDPAGFNRAVQPPK